MSGVEFVRSAIEVAQRAVFFESAQNYQVAIYFYNEAYLLLQRAIGEEGQSSENIPKWTQKAQEYLDRLIALNFIMEERAKEEMSQVFVKSEEEKLLEKAQFLMSQALSADESGNSEFAIQNYTEAVQVCLDARKLGSVNPDLREKLTKLATQGLERAEILRGLQIHTEPQKIKTIDKNSEDLNLVTTRGSAAANTKKTSDLNVPNSPGSANLKKRDKEGYSEEEKKVLVKTSEVNGISYLPFLEIDLREKFNYFDNFTDPDGLLKLSPKQRSHFKRWSRPSEIFPTPQMLVKIDSFTIKQTLVSDCSFVASLAIAANYEKKFNKKLLRKIIYPQNESGEPVWNPSGKYMVKLLVNGVRRKVIIDDLLPTGRNNELLCSYSNRKGELWVSLLEKAYMKVMGGYDFPGSNSNIDLHALTGWIPERRSISSDPSKTRTFEMLMKKLNDGSVLVTIATGDLDEKIAERAGLVPTHAYAVLDIREVNGVKLFLVKNPWSHLRWRGNYSELDATHWTAEMKNILNYDPNNAKMFDNGVFWIDYESIIKFFDVIYMSWNPSIFPFSYTLHKSWSSSSGPIKDVYSLGENPQFLLEIPHSNNSLNSTIWVLLTRHIVDISDFKDNNEYITLLVYENGGTRVFYPSDPPPLVDGVRINSPHYLCKINSGGGGRKYTLVVSQYEKTNNIFYTLKVYGSCEFRVGEIEGRLKFGKKIVGEWRRETAGGESFFFLIKIHFYRPLYTYF